jgi:crotonobetainyl-CoA:carnitine CoA-transferase CaiB-like acyl-CoA transferase
MSPLRSQVMPFPLEGVRILAVSQFGAGPFGTMLLADMAQRSSRLKTRKRVETYRGMFLRTR